MDSRWILPVALLVLIVIPAAVAAGPSVVRSLTKDERPFSLCPPDRGSGQIVSGSRMAEDGAAYRGPGPHRLLVDGPSDATEGMPSSWVPGRASNGAYQVAELQLVVCEYQYAVGSQGTLQTCAFRPVGGGALHTFTEQSATYDYRVYEVTTAKQLTSFTLAAVRKPCVDFRSVADGAGGDTKFPGNPDYAVLQRKLQPLVTADVPG